LTVSVTEGITADHLYEIYTDPYIAKVGHDHRKAWPIFHPNVQYLSAWVGDVFAGAFMVIRYTDIELELHSLLKRAAILHSRKLGVALLNWAFEQPIQRVTAYIIEGLEKTVNLCLKLGFKPEGRRREAIMQKGVIKDIIILGMTRADWEKTL